MSSDGADAVRQQPLSPRDQQGREFLLAQLRCASLRARLTAADLDTVGIALRAGIVDPEAAVDWLLELGLTDVLALRSEKTRP
jgi:hypothetical protein